jgi:hypothetical protein
VLQIDLSHDEEDCRNVNTKKKTQIDDVDLEGNEALSPEVRERLAKLKELNDAYNVSDEDFEVDPPPSTKKQVHTLKKKSVAVVQSKKIKGKKGSKNTQMNYTVEIVLATWTEDTEYGKTFRSLNVEEQSAEVKRLNVGTTKGVKNVIKKKCWMQTSRKRSLPKCRLTWVRVGCVSRPCFMNHLRIKMWFSLIQVLYQWGNGLR